MLIIGLNMTDNGFTPEEFIDVRECTSDNQQKNELIDYLQGKAVWGLGNTKADCGGLSRGCTLCGRGLWSCLFINNICDAGCFYCPDTQHDRCLPVSNSITFESTGEYIKYLRKFGFKGCSVSGGEPMMTPKLTLTYISAVKNAFHKDMYVWMYTNGRLINDASLCQLRDTGLDEIRFDIAADGYRTEKVFSACKVIPVVTVEIPAIPEDEARLQNLLPSLAEAGVKHLNLHQIMMTEHNCGNMLRHGYHFTHDNSPLLPDSELMALRLIKYVKDNSIGINVNYCSGAYQRRYQGAGYRKMFGKYVMDDGDVITDAGYIKTHEKSDGKDLVSYSFGVIRPAVTYMNRFTEIRLTRHKTVSVERVSVARHIEAGSAEADQYEKIPLGLPDYL